MNCSFAGGSDFVFGANGDTENSLETIDKPRQNLHHIHLVPFTNFRYARCLRGYMTVWTKQGPFSPTR